MREYQKEIISVFYNNVCIGFIARQSIIFGMRQGHDDEWCATSSIIAPVWKRGFINRRRAAEWLIINRSPQVAVSLKELASSTAYNMRDKWREFKARWYIFNEMETIVSWDDAKKATKARRQD